VLLAAAMLADVPNLLLDEPLEAMDGVARGRIRAWLDRCLGRGAAALVVSHELEPFLAAATALVTVRGGQVARRSPPAPLAERRALVERLARGE
jgi:ABC-type sulfate/molybdate transport systems ATPase subunit